MIYLLLIILLVIVLSLIVPTIMYVYNYRQSPKVTRFYFSHTLLDFNLKELSFEKIRKNDGDREAVNRFALANRGWVRYLNGEIMDNDMFQKKRDSEYSIELP